MNSARHELWPLSLSRKTSTLRAIPYKLPRASSHQKTQATGQKKTSQRYSQRQVTIVMVPTRQLRQSMRAARQRMRTSSAIRKTAVRRRRGTESRKANCITPRWTLAGNSVGALLEGCGCRCSWAKRLVGRPTPKRQVASARGGERKARRTSSRGLAPGEEKEG